MGWQVSRNPPKSFSCKHLADQSVYFSIATCCLDSKENEVLEFERILEPISFPPTHKLLPRFYKYTHLLILGIIHTFWASRLMSQRLLSPTLVPKEND